ncbi:hypothetical protein E8E95_14705 [Pseudomonas sp. BN414]|uniref:hypothetical protein n=1 Tax=Pseudomonas sp. BN414 TaxID=2567888 RepID=UPI002454365A|nr:hypothetical protein [Pseudomonas sp. BN414]MDH4567931.1 hypothetical protein [Pseudomonas sp. BN414]
MKVGIDLKDHRTQFILHLIASQNEKALSIPQAVESAVFPIFHVIKSGKQPVQIGSCVAIQIGGEHFFFSASHVFDDIGKYKLCIGLGNGEPLAYLGGDRFSSLKGKSGTHSDDPIDASVYHIQEAVPEIIKKDCLTLDDLDLEPRDDFGCVYLAAGFRSKISKTRNNQANTRREALPSRELDDGAYLSLDLDRETHIALFYENQIIKNGRWQTSPIPKGMSGGAIIKISKIPFLPKQYHPEELAARQLLTGITIEQRRERNGKPGILLGTRISKHLALIEKFLPEVLPETWNQLDKEN